MRRTVARRLFVRRVALAGRGALGCIAAAVHHGRSWSPPLFPRQAFVRWLFLPIRSHVNALATRPAFRTHDLARKRRHFGIGRIVRHVDQPLVPARIAEASGDEPLHAKRTHVAERHRRAVRLALLLDA